MNKIQKLNKKISNVNESTSEKEFVDIIDAALVCLEDDDDSDLDISRTQSFRSAGLLTKDKGLVVKLRDGSKFQVTVRKV